MAKLVKTIEDGKVTTTLTFRSENFTVTMLPYVEGESRSLEKCFESQFAEKFPNDENIDGICEALDELSFADDDEIMDILGALEEYEHQEENT